MDVQLAKDPDDVSQMAVFVCAYEAPYRSTCWQCKDIHVRWLPSYICYKNTRPRCPAAGPQRMNCTDSGLSLAQSDALAWPGSASW